MNIYYFKRKKIFLLISVLIVLSFLYLQYSLNRIEEDEFGQIKIKKVGNLNKKFEIKHEKNEIKFEDSNQIYKPIDNLQPVNNDINNNFVEIKDLDHPYIVSNNILLSEISKKTNDSKSVKAYETQCEWYREQQEMNTDIQTADLLSKITFDDINGGVWKQGFDITYQENQWSQDNKLHIFVVPHSHNDPGWIMTFEEYFHQRTKNILNTIVMSLSEKPRRKFIWAETSYLSLWWQQASNEMKDKMRKLIVETKQLEIVTGGWVMTDEANSYYYAMIEQMIEGHEWLKANIDTTLRPTYGWSIDPFGYTPTMAYLLKQMGFNAMLIQRVHYSIKKYMGKTNRLEFNWKQSWSTPSSKDTNLFCHVMPFYSYDVPHTCGPDPKVCCQFDFPRISNYGGCPWGINPQKINDGNVHERAWTLLDQYRKKAQLYGGDKNHNVVLIPLGDDFRYRDLSEVNLQLENYEMLMDYMNSRKDWNVDIKFGTLKDYFEKLHNLNLKTNHQVETFSGDFFTYADRENHYWSGYYTSRPFNKRLDRVVEHYLRSAEIVFSYANLLQHRIGKLFEFSNPLFIKLLEARRNLGLFQHHDGVTGTSKTPVVWDYANKLFKSLTNSKEIIEHSISYLLGQENNGKNLLNLDDVRVKAHKDEKKIQYIDFSDIQEKEIILYNSNLNERIEIVSFKVNIMNLAVYDDNEQLINDAQVSMLWPNMEGVDLSEFNNIKISSTENLKFAFDFDQNNFELLFQVKLAPLSLTKFTIKKTIAINLPSSEVKYYHKFNNADSVQKLKSDILNRGGFSEKAQSLGEKILFDSMISDDNAMIQLDSDNYQVKFSQKYGFLDNIVDKFNKKTKSTFKFVKYGTTDKKDKSGAYLFLPDGPAVDIDFKNYVQWFRVEKNGQLRNRVCIHMTILIHCVQYFPTLDKIRGFKTPLFHVWNVVDLRHTHNFELVMHIDTDIQNKNQFYTDLNGFQYTKRKNYRKLTLQGNVYPMPSGAFIQDSSKRLNILSGQPLGVASQDQSSLQVFLDRKLDQDDNRGMEQAVDDNVLTSSKFLVFFEEINEDNFGKSLAKNHPSLLSQILSFHLINPIIRLVSTVKVSSTFKSNVKLAGESNLFPCDLRLLNMRTMQTTDEKPLDNEIGLILHRLAHEDCQLSSVIQSNSYLEKQCKMASNLTFTTYFDFFDKVGSIKTQLKVSSTYLTMQNKEGKQSLSSNDLILNHIQPMQIEAFKVSL